MIRFETIVKVEEKDIKILLEYHLHDSSYNYFAINGEIIIDDIEILEVDGVAWESIPEKELDDLYDYLDSNILDLVDFEEEA